MKYKVTISRDRGYCVTNTYPSMEAAEAALGPGDTILETEVVDEA